MQIVKRNSQEFEVLPRRWLVERTFAWLVQNRRLAVDYEQLPEISEALNILVLLVIGLTHERYW